jgi:hypothetical protein
MHTCPITAELVSLMLPSQHHASFSIALKRFLISLYARLMSFPHKINPLDYAMNLSFILHRHF